MQHPGFARAAGTPCSCSRSTAPSLGRCGIELCRDLESVRGVVDVVDRAVVLGLEEEGVEVQGPHAHVLVLAGRGHEPTVARKRP